LSHIQSFLLAFTAAFPILLQRGKPCPKKFAKVQLFVLNKGVEKGIFLKKTGINPLSAKRHGFEKKFVHLQPLRSL
jgi:hypothetical protein